MLYHIIMQALWEILVSMKRQDNSSNWWMMTNGLKRIISKDHSCFGMNITINSKKILFSHRLWCIERPEKYRINDFLISATYYLDLSHKNYDIRNGSISRCIHEIHSWLLRIFLRISYSMKNLISFMKTWISRIESIAPAILW